MQPLSFAEYWIWFFERLDASNDRIMTELESCWRDFQSIVESQLNQREDASVPTSEPTNLESFHAKREAIGQEFLLEPVAQWERKRPYLRALTAIDTYDHNLQELVKSIPEWVVVNGPEVLDVLDRWVMNGWWRRMTKVRRKERTLPLRALVAAVLQKQTATRTRIEGMYFESLILAIRQLRRHWELTRAALDASVSGRPFSSQELNKLWLEAKTATENVKEQIERALSEWRAWSKFTNADLARQVVTHVAWPHMGKPVAVTDQRSAALSHWGQLRRAGEEEIHLEQTLERTERQILGLLQQGLDSLMRERTNLLTELDVVIDWLHQQIQHPAREDFPPPKVDIVPASSRLADLEASVKSELGALPESSEILTNPTPLPHRRSRWTTFHPRQTLYQAFLRVGRGDIERELAAIESEHKKIVQQIERAREVVAYGLETDGSEPEVDSQVAQEALQNALSMLEFDRREMPDWSPAADRAIARALAAVFIETRVILNRHRLGALAYLAQQGFRRAIVLVSQNALTTLVEGLGRSYRFIEQIVLQFLVYIGWRQAVQEDEVEVVTRPVLPQEFTVDLSTKELPAIYRRLFRFEAVQDPRFLVGREQEMAAINEARSFWEAGRPASLLIIGQRGSGKTSLINCALKRELDGLEVIRGEFSERLGTEPQLRDYLANLVGVNHPAELEPFLSEQRRVIILEELERTFLRQIGYYAAVRSLQRLISATCSSTLWILVINQIAFQFLDASVSLGGSFSHRVNAASASRDALRQAILLRHNLSGLRLQFALLPAQRRLTQRLRGLVQGSADPESLFFDTLAHESAGIFRAAFEIWLGQIESVQAGVMYMNPLVPPDLSPVINDLDLTDLFTLVAISQHGSLTPEEHAIVFQKSLAASRAQMDELLAREIIESEPGRPGFRIRPEAMRVVREALYRRNLL